MDGFDLERIDEVIHGRLRLGIMAYLAHAEAADRRRRVVAFGRGAQRRQRFDAGRVEWRPGVRGAQLGAVERQAQPRPDPGTSSGVGGVLGEFDDDPVAIAAEDEVLLGVGVLAKPR